MADGTLVSAPAADDVDARYARAVEKRRKREEAAERKRQLALVEGEELIERFSSELNGAVGIDFDIVDLTDVGEGFVVVKLGENVLWNTFSKSKMSDVDKDAFVLPCLVHPDRDSYRKTVGRKGFCADRVATALAGLYGAKAKEDRGK